MKGNECMMKAFRDSTREELQRRRKKNSSEIKLYKLLTRSVSFMFYSLDLLQDVCIMKPDVYEKFFLPNRAVRASLLKCLLLFIFLCFHFDDFLLHINLLKCKRQLDEKKHEFVCDSFRVSAWIEITSKGYQIEQLSVVLNEFQ